MSSHKAHPSPLFSYFGGKIANGNRYPKPRYQTIVEPFAGSAGYSLWFPAHRVVLVEKSPKLAALWAWLIRVSPEEILSLPTEIDDLRTMDLIPEAKTLIGFWLNAATPSPNHYVRSVWGHANKLKSNYWSHACKQRIAKTVPLIRHWKVVEGDYTLAMDHVQGDATWFVDPPYEKAGKVYPESSRNLDFDAVGRWCRGLPGQVIVCENEGAAWLPFRPFRKFSKNGTRGGGGSREAIWLSDEPNRRARVGLGLDINPRLRVRRITE